MRHQIGGRAGEVSLQASDLKFRSPALKPVSRFLAGYSRAFVAGVPWLKMTHFFWRCFPVVVLTVQIRDWGIHEFFRRHIV